MAAWHRANSTLAAFAALLIGVAMLAGLSPSSALAETGAQASSPAAKNLTTAASTDLCDATIEIEPLFAIPTSDGGYAVRTPRITVHLNGETFEASNRCRVEWMGPSTPEAINAALHGEGCEIFPVDGPSIPGIAYWPSISADESKYPGYTGAIQVEYKLLDPFNVRDAKIAWPKWESSGWDGWYDYTGKPVSFDKLLVLDGKTLTLNVDYTVKCYKRYENGLDSGSPVEVKPIDVGDYDVQFTGKGDYSGALRGSFLIRDFSDLKDASLNAESFFAGSMPKNFTPEVFVGDGYNKSDLLQLGKDYVINGYKVYNKKTKKWKKISNFDAKTPGEYLLTIKAAKGSKYHGKNLDGAWFEVLDPYDLKNAEIEFDRCLIATNKSSKPINPVKSVTLAGKKLKEGRDYRVVYREYDKDEVFVPIKKEKKKDLKSIYKKGHYIFGIVPGNGTSDTPCEYKQSQKFTDDHECYLVAANNLKAAKTTLPRIIAMNSKTGKVKVPSFKVVLGGKTLPKSAYTVKYRISGDVEDGNGDFIRGIVDSPIYPTYYEVIISAKKKSGYTGTLICGLDVCSPFELGGAKLDLKKSVYTYTGKAIKPKLTITSASGAKLKEGKHYRLMYRNPSGIETSKAPSAEGRYRVYAVGLGKYKSNTYWYPYDIVKPAPKIKASNKTVAVGKTVKIGAKTKSKGKMAFKSSNKKVAKVSKKGVIKGLRAGTAKITITVAAKGKYAEGTKTIKVVVS